MFDNFQSFTCFYVDISPEWLELYFSLLELPQLNLNKPNTQITTALVNQEQIKPAKIAQLNS